MKKLNKKTLLFVCGFPSGGTDLTKTILNAHPEIYLSGEIPGLEKLKENGYSASTLLQTDDDIKKLEKFFKEIDIWKNIEFIDNIYDQFLPYIRNNENDLRLVDVMSQLFLGPQTTVTIWGNKTPQYTENIATLHNLFPDAKWIIITRDIRDICLSWQKKWGKDINLCAAKWAVRMEKGILSSKSFAELRLVVKYEDLLADTEKTCKAICSFLGLSFSERMLEHHKYTGNNPGKINYGQPVDSKNTDKWRKALSVKSVKRIEEIAFNAMFLLDYKPEFAILEQKMTRKEILRGMICDIISLIFVGNRADPDNSQLKRVKNAALLLRRRFS